MQKKQQKRRGSSVAKLKAGDAVAIPCEVAAGQSAEERLVSFETIGGRVTGFVRTHELRDRGGNQWVIRATVLKVRRDAIEVRVYGSFFNTNGLADIKPEMALAA
jgi:hypothetical protein